MSRFGDGRDEEFPGEFALWEAAIRNAIRGKRGQGVLRELREALLSMPNKQLIEGRLFTEQGEVCAMGALAAHRAAQGLIPGNTLRSAPPRTARELEEHFGCIEDDYSTLDFGERVLKLTNALAWAISWENDYYTTETPDQRYERVLRWVERQIATPKEKTP